MLNVLQRGIQCKENEKIAVFCTADSVTITTTSRNVTDVQHYYIHTTTKEPHNNN